MFFVIIVENAMQTTPKGRPEECSRMQRSHAIQSREREKKEKKKEQRQLLPTRYIMGDVSVDSEERATRAFSFLTIPSRYVFGVLVNTILRWKGRE